MRHQVSLAQATLLCLLLAPPSSAVPGVVTAHEEGEGGEPQPIREEGTRYTLPTLAPLYPDAYGPCQGIGGACFSIDGTEAFRRILLKDDFSERVCATVEAWNANRTQGVATGGCGAITMPIAQPPARWPPPPFRGWPSGLTDVIVRIEPIDGLLFPDPGTIATSGTITLHAYE